MEQSNEEIKEKQVGLPEIEEIESLKEKFKNSLYYVLIVIFSIILVVVGPLIEGSTGTIAPNFPSTAFGWILWTISKIAAAFINIMILILFTNQAKINVKDVERYKEAREMIAAAKRKNKSYIPISEKEYDKRTYTKKGTTIFITSILSLVALSDLILRYSPSILISYGVTWAMGIIFGILAMKKKETYFITEYYDYAIMMQEKSKSSKEETK